MVSPRKQHTLKRVAVRGLLHQKPYELWVLTDLRDGL